MVGACAPYASASAGLKAILYSLLRSPVRLTAPSVLENPFMATGEALTMRNTLIITVLFLFGDALLQAASVLADSRVYLSAIYPSSSGSGQTNKYFLERSDAVLSAKLGQALSFRLELASTSGLSLQWYKDGEPIPGATQQEYTMASVAAQDYGEYAVLVTDSEGRRVSQPAQLVPFKSVTEPDAATWVGFTQAANVVYFAFSNPARLERYDLQASKWLAPLPMDREITALAASSEFLYVAKGPEVYRYDLAGTSPTLLHTATADVRHILPTQKWLVCTASTAADLNVFMSVSTLLIVPIGGGPATSSMTTSLGRPRARIFDEASSRFYYMGFDYDWDRRTMSLDDLGVLGAPQMPTTTEIIWDEKAELLFCSKDGDYLLSGGGRMYRKSDFSYAAILDPFVDLAFLEDGRAVTLKGSTLNLLNSDFHRERSIDLQRGGLRVVSWGARAFVFSAPATSGGMPNCEEVDLEARGEEPSSASPMLEGDSEDYYAESITLDPDGNILLFAPLSRQVFRWSPETRSYLPGLGLRGMPEFFAQDSLGVMYFSYANQRVTKASFAAPVEKEIYMPWMRITGLATYGNGLIVTDLIHDSWHFDFQYVIAFDRACHIVSVEPSHYMSIGRLLWSDATGILYFEAPAGLVPNSTAFSAMRFNEHGKRGGRDVKGVKSTDGGAGVGLSVNAEGTKAAFGGGQVISIESGSVLTTLSQRFVDAAWLSNALYTVSSSDQGTLIQRWGGETYAAEKSAKIEGHPRRILVLPDGHLVVVHEVQQKIRFTILDASLASGSVSSGKPRATFANISSRARVGEGDDVAIAGFVVGGAGRQKVLIRAAGPELRSQNVSGFLSNPQIEIYNSNQQRIISNRDWGVEGASSEALENVFAKVGAFDFSRGSRDAALVAELDPGLYTAVMTGESRAQGVGLVEVYSLYPDSPENHLVNISTRAKVGSGDGVLIGGFVVHGTQSKKLLVRAAGPALLKQKVTGVLANPRFKVYSRKTLIAENDDWDGSAALTEAFVRTGAFPFDPGSKDSALVLDLAPGQYTVVVEGADGGEGIALVEVYELSGS